MLIENREVTCILPFSTLIT